MTFPKFSFKHLPEMLASCHETERTTLGLGRGSSRTDQAQSAFLGQTRIEDWARTCGRHLTPEAFGERLNGTQVESQLSEIFRETPEFGRSIAKRLADFHDESSDGPLTLIGAGGEAVVFFDTESQQVLKLLSPAGRAEFGWAIDRDASGKLILRPGGLVESLQRYALAEATFPTGLELEALGSSETGSFLILKQPFFLGTNPEPAALNHWMQGQGWQKIRPETELETLQELTWSKDDLLATDVRPENVIQSEADQQLYPFDLILASSSAPKQEA